MPLDPWSQDFYVKCFLPMLRRESHPRMLWPCLSWSGLRSSKGYGVIALPDGLMQAHVYSLRMIGVDPGDNFVRHMCDVRACCNPVHLLLGSAQDNARDRTYNGARRGSLARAWTPFAPNYIPNRFQRARNPWTAPLEAS